MSRITLPAWCALGALVLALVLILRADLAHLAWVANLAREGSPPPALDATSPTGYSLSQRHFLAPQQRGETYRWITETQAFLATGPWSTSHYEGDTAPEGRPGLLPKLYTSWLAVVAWGIHVVNGDAIAIAVERAALWEPLVSHLLAFTVSVIFMWVRFGPAAAGVTGLLFALLPPLSGQFLPGTLTTSTWALLLAAGAIALHLPSRGKPATTPTWGIGSAVAAGLALWLDPAFGFPAVLLLAAAGAASILTQPIRLRFLSWSLAGAGVTLIACLIDQNPWDPAAGEFRYVHPLYALAWLGLGLALDGGQRLRLQSRVTSSRRSLPAFAEMVAAFALVAPLVTTQLTTGFAGWLYTGATMGRLTSLDETTLFNSALAWLARASATEALLVCAPVLVAGIALAGSLRANQTPSGESRSSSAVAAITLVGVVALACFKVRWGVVASLVALPLAWGLASRASAGWRRGGLAFAVVFLVGLIAWGKVLPASLQRPSEDTLLRAADLEALVYRHFSHWMASHHPGQPVSALAPPELADSLVFHGGGRVLMSTAWESHPGHVAASRILSAQEATEAEAVLESLQLTHMILTSWDHVLPLLVRKPEVAGRDTLHARLQRWVLPRFLRAVPYHLPAVPGYRDQNLAVFKITAPQDEALALSRLAEYFVEMDRPEPAGLVATVLADSFPDDPNAMLARATVYEHAKVQTALDRELTRLVADATAGKAPFEWDRRVQRAILLVLGKRPELARTEIEACARDASAEAMYELTPLQAYRLRALARRFLVEFSDPKLTELLDALGAEYSAVPAAPAPR